MSRPVGDARRAWRTLHARARKAEARNRALLVQLADLQRQIAVLERQLANDKTRIAALEAQQRDA